jgi:hypothetical protein
MSLLWTTEQSCRAATSEKEFGSPTSNFEILILSFISSERTADPIPMTQLLYKEAYAQVKKTKSSSRTAI